MFDGPTRVNRIPIVDIHTIHKLDQMSHDWKEIASERIRRIGPAAGAVPRHPTSRRIEERLISQGRRGFPFGIASERLGVLNPPGVS